MSLDEVVKFGVLVQGARLTALCAPGRKQGYFTRFYRITEANPSLI